jgi:hypothetical protein
VRDTPLFDSGCAGALRRAAHLVLTALLALLPLGCGAVLPSEEAMQGGFSGRTKERFVAQVDAICREADDQVAALAPPANAEERPKFIAQLAEIRKVELDRVNALEHPVGGEEQVRFEVVESSLRNRLAMIKAMGLKLGFGRLAEADDLAARLGPETQDLRRAAKIYGLNECGRV